MKNRQPEKSFQTKKSVQTMWACLAVVGLVCVAVGLLTGKNVPAGGVVATVGVMMSVWTRRRPIIRLYADYFEMKVAPLASLRRVLYRDLKRVEVVNAKMARVTFKDQGKASVFKIPLNMLSADDGEALVQFLSETAAAGRSKFPAGLPLSIIGSYAAAAGE